MASGHEYAYNYIFQDLVRDENDLIGAIAYSIYKRRKIEWLKTYKEEHGIEPPPEHMHVFNSTSLQQMEGYKAQAHDVMDEFMKSAGAQMYDEISQELTEEFNNNLNALDERIGNGVDKLMVKHHEKTQEILNSHKHGWGRAIAEHVIAGIFTTLLTGAMLLLLSAYFDKEKLIVQIKKNVVTEETRQEKMPPAERKPE